MSPTGADARLAGKGLLQVALAGVLVLAFAILPSTAQAAGGQPWTSYMNGVSRTGYTSDGTITTANAVTLARVWSYTASPKLQYNSIFSQPIVGNGSVYFGSFDGYEYAFSMAGTMQWRAFLGRTVDNVKCNPPQVGVASTAALGSAAIGGTRHNVVFVGGGDATLYALDAGSGAQLWATRLGSSPSHFLWSSPAYYSGSVYIGMASFGDCPLVQGQVIKLNAATGAVQATFNTVPDGCTGAGVWATPAIDPATGMLFVTTGNNGNCSVPERYSFSFVELRSTDLSFVASWQAPTNLVPDSDFGATTTLFTANGQPMVGAPNKNGWFYALNRNNIAAGPVWQKQVGVGGDCPQCGQAVIAPAAFDGAHLYTGSGQTTINGQACDGSVRELDPATGTSIWERCFIGGNAKYPASVLGAITTNPNVVVAGAGTSVVVLDKTTGASRFEFDTHQVSSSFQPSFFWGSQSLSGGRIYAGNMDGSFYALGLGGQ